MVPFLSKYGETSRATDARSTRPRSSALTHSLSRNDLLKLAELAGEARRSIRHFQEQDRTHNREREQQDQQEHSLADERDAAMADAAPEQGRRPAQSRSRQAPQYEPGMG